MGSLDIFTSKKKYIFIVHSIALNVKNIVMNYQIKFLLVVAIAMVITSTFISCACVYNNECGHNGRCLGGVCVNEECRANIDCIGRGLYFKCRNGKCEKSSHKICRSNDDCKKNLLNTKCVEYRCSR